MKYPVNQHCVELLVANREPTGVGGDEHSSRDKVSGLVARDRLANQRLRNVDTYDVEITIHKLEGTATLRASDVEEPGPFRNFLFPGFEGDQVCSAPE